MKEVALAFPGQGKQYPGLYQDLYDQFAIVRETFDEASEALHSDIKKLCFESSLEEIRELEKSQRCIMTVEVAGFRLCRSLGLKPKLLIGCSFGAYSAAVAAGVLPLREGLQISDMRAESIHRAMAPGQSGMLVVMNHPLDDIRRICQEYKGRIWISNFNGPTQIVLSGLKEAIDAMYDYTVENDIMAVNVDVDFASHCPLMKPVTRRMHEVLTRYPFLPARIPLVASSTGEAMTEPLEIKRELADQLSRPVQFEKAIHYSTACGVDTFIELGPGKALSGNITRIDPCLTACRIENIESLNETKSILGL